LKKGWAAEARFFVGQSIYSTSGLKKLGG